jgi:uncharacterized membrane protein YccC
MPVSLNLRAISLAEGVRAALAVAVVMLLSEWFRLPLLAEAAVGALLTCLCDVGGPVRRRIPALLSFAAVGAVLTTGFALLRPYGLPITVPIATLVVFALSLARVWGQAAMQVGNLLVVVMVLSLDAIQPPPIAFELGTLFTGGSLWALALTMVIWRLHPFRPARQATADVFRRLGLMVTELVPLLDPAATTADWAAHARAHRRHVRDGIEAARVLVLDTVRIRGGGSARANQSLIQVEAADQLFGVLIALSDVLENADAPARAAAVRALPALRLLLAALADATARDHATDDPAVRAMTTQMLDAFGKLRSVPALSGIAEAIVSRLKIALLLTTPDGLLPGQDGTEGRRIKVRERVLAPIRANLRWDSAILRHATRAAVVAAPALAFTLAMGTAYAHWLTITLVLTLQPFFAQTWQKALERCAGTVLGGVCAAGIAIVITTPIATALVMIPLAIAAFACRAVSFGLFMVFLTPMVVLLSELGRPDTSELVIAALRAAYTIAGGVIAVASGVLLWPSWEPTRVRQAMEAAIKAHGAYADLELTALLRPGTVTAASLEAVRRAAGLASNNLEAALNRALQEPRQSARRESETALVVDAALRRLAGRLLALQHDPAQAGSDPVLIEAWRQWMAASFKALQSGKPLPATELPDDNHPALGRMARQIALIAGALAGPQEVGGNKHDNSRGFLPPAVGPHMVSE